MHLLQLRLILIKRLAVLLRKIVFQTKEELAKIILMLGDVLNVVRQEELVKLDLQLGHEDLSPSLDRLNNNNHIISLNSPFISNNQLLLFSDIKNPRQ